MVLGAVLLAGCAAPPGAIGGTRNHHVLILPGIGGSSPGLRALSREITATGAAVDMDAAVWDWTRVESPVSLFGLPNITNHPRNVRRAERLAAEIVTWQQQHPDRRLTLMGHSGGGGMALMAVERLPPGASVNLERVVLLSPAVSPCRDLSPVLRRTRNGIFNYHSRADRFILHLSTRIFGTMERERTAAAGCVGFARCDPRVEELCWTRSMIRHGNRGGHFGAFRIPFARRFILPELTE